MPSRTRVRVDDRALKALELKMKRAERARVKVGVLASRGGAERHPEHPESNLSMIEIAAIHEFGSPAANIPQRSFIRSALDGRRSEVKVITEKVAKALLIGRVDVAGALTILGQWAVARVQARMAEGIPPPLAPSTLAKRRRIQRGKAGSDKPLIDTDRLRQSIAYEVVTGGDE